MAEDKHRATLYVELRALEPLHLGGRHLYGSYRAGETVLHGGRVLAALAEAAGEYPLFGGGTDLIVEDSPAFAEGSTIRDEVVYLPLTAESCKAFPGDWFEPEYHWDEKRDGIWDTLADRWLLSKGAANVPKHWGRCPRCEAAVKPFSCFVHRRRTGAGSYRYQAAVPLIERRTHTALNPTRGTAEFGMLFTEDLIAPDTYFYLRLLIQGKTREELDQRINRLTEELLKQPFRLGGAKSRGHGMVKATRIEDRPPFAEALPDRIKDLDHYLKSKLRESKLWGGVADNAAANDRTFFYHHPSIAPDPSGSGDTP